MPEVPVPVWIIVAAVGAALFIYLAVITIERGWRLWKRYRHENGTPDIRKFDPDSDDLPSDHRD